MTTRFPKSFGVLTALLVAAPAWAAADPVLTWNVNAGTAAIAACLSPGGNALAEARMYAMVHVAVHDALNAIDRRSRPYEYDADVSTPTSADAAAAAAARDVLVAVIARLQETPQCVAAGIVSADASYAAALASIPTGAPKAAGILLGQAAAAAIIARRDGDGSDLPVADPDYPQGTEPGEYRFTPGLPFAFGTYWGDVTPFVLADGSQFRPGPPDRVSGRKFARDFNEIKPLGGDGITTPHDRTPFQTQTGLFWIESSPLAWNRMARGVSVARGLDPWENARLFGLLNLALADGYIASWNAKYHYNYWRPVTAIQTADTDGNPDTDGDASWTPLQLTYPMPDYPSGHAVEGGAAAEVLRRFFGTDRIEFTVCSLSLPAGQTCADPSPVMRTYTRFSEAAAENAESRILIGIHFRKAVEEGVEQGRKVGRRTVNLFLKPEHR